MYTDRDLIFSLYICVYSCWTTLYIVLNINMICSMFISTVCTHLYKEHCSVNYMHTLTWPIPALLRQTLSFSESHSVTVTINTNPARTLITVFVYITNVFFSVLLLASDCWCLLNININELHTVYKHAYIMITKNRVNYYFSKKVEWR